MIPDFYCIGTQKAGTTTLHSILSQHPDICLPAVKETHFFYAEEEYAKGLDYYSGLFGCAGERSIIGEIDPSYMYFPSVPKRIFDAYGDRMKFIVVLRNPVDRLVSQYLMCRQYGYERYDLRTALEIEGKRIQVSESNKGRFSYAGRGLYAQQIKRFLQLFPRENFLYLVFESQFVTDLTRTTARILEFLDVPVIDLDVDIHANITKRPLVGGVNSLIYGKGIAKRVAKFMLPVPAVRTRIKGLLERPVRKDSVITADERVSILEKYYLNDIQELETLIGVDLGLWYKDIVPGT